ncbi:MAG: thiol protease/hemagglutinin PrtT [Bacteroidales bacterium]|nr:thiol protease/hemagglutinin PrtT [Bacteroidales bacterium]
MNKIISFFIALIFSASLLAQNISPEQAQTVAKSFYAERSKHLMIEKNANVDFKLYDKISRDDGKILGYIFNADGGHGFVMVSAFDNCIPVLAYSLTQSFDNSVEQPEAVNAILTDYKRQLIIASENPEIKDAGIEDLWINYLYTKESKDVSAAGPLLSTTWDQGCNYNADCPYDASAGSYMCYHVPTGCGATAQAQIMKYWSWPTNGIGSHSYSSSYGTLSANFGTSNYNWGAMPNNVSSSNSEVAKTMSHIGISVDMGYSASGSGSYIADHKSSFRYYFDYKSTIALGVRSNYNDVTWAALLKGQVDAGKPVFYTGYDAAYTSGHAFVLDGYQSTGGSTDYFHFNFGWGGYYDGYYRLNNIAPGTGGTGGGAGDYSYGNQILYNIEPNGTPNPGTSCDTIGNYGTESATYYSFTTQWGYWTGQNGYGWDEYAEKFSSVSTPIISGLYVAVVKATNMSGSAKVTFKVYSGGTTPGSVIAQKDVYYSTLNPGYWNLIQFTSPVTTTGNYYLGYEVYYNTPQDTFATYMSTVPVSSNTGYLHDGSSWTDYPSINSSVITHLWIDAIACPNATEIPELDVPDAFVYPNPANDIINVFGIHEEFTAFIYDSQGRLALHKVVNGSINIADLTTGIYYIRGYNADGKEILNKKFMKE